LQPTYTRPDAPRTARRRGSASTARGRWPGRRGPPRTGRRDRRTWDQGTTARTVLQMRPDRPNRRTERTVPVMPEPQGSARCDSLKPPGSTELLLIRHGESEPVVPGRPFPRRRPRRPELAPEGRVQAEQIADRSPPPDRRDLRHDAAPTRADGGPARRRTRARARRRARPARGQPRRVGGRALPQARRRGPPLALRMLTGAALGRHPRRRVAESLAPACAAPSTASSPPTPASASPSFSHGGVIGEILAQVTRPAGRSPSSARRTHRSARSSPSAALDPAPLQRHRPPRCLAGADLDRDPDLPGA
jgi:probable phosphoglycerate mutase